MFALNTLTELLGWACVINVVVYSLSALALTVFRRPVTRLQSKVTGLSEQALAPAYFHYLANFKLLFLMFNFSPWMALKIMGY